jgi:predicted DNA-binding helix-hairpin-helix protein
VSRNDTEYSYRISVTWNDIPANSDVQYICSALRNEDGIVDERVEYVHVYGKYSILRTYSSRNFPCNAMKTYEKYDLMQ